MTVKRKCFSTEKNRTISTTATQEVVFKISIIISRRDLTAAITLSTFSRVAKSDVETRRAVASVTAIMSVAVISLSPSEFSNTTCLSCDAAFVNRTFDYTNRSVIERSIVFDHQSFGNRTFDCVRLAKFYCEFDYVWLSSAIEQLVFDWVRLPNCSIG